MKNGILIIAHAPLASALRQCVLHVFPDAAPALAAFDVQANVPIEETLAGAAQALAILGADQTLVLINGKRVDIPSYAVRKGDKIELREESRQLTLVVKALQFADSRPTPSFHAPLVRTRYRRSSRGTKKAPVRTRRGAQLAQRATASGLSFHGNSAGISG